MKKRIITFVLVIAMLFANVALFPFAAEPDLKQQSMSVESYGTFYTQKVYTDKSATIFVPITMLAQFGGLSCSESSSGYTLYRKNETNKSTLNQLEFLAGARTITINKSGTNATVSCYTSKNVAKTVSTINFSKSHTVDKKLYLPLVEALPLLDAKVEITKDGIVHIYANPMSAFYALYSGNIDLCVFDAGDMVGSGFISASGLIVDSVLNFRFDRLDTATNSGAIKDYSNLFKKLLVDNETYLSAFDKTETPLEKQITLINNEYGDFSDKASGVDDLVKAYEYLFSSTKHSTYKQFSDTADGELHEGVDIIDGVGKVISYADRYTKQVNDHRNMLNAVYGGGSKPAAVAANEVYTLYGQNTVPQITSAVTSTLRDYLSKIFSGAISGAANLTPYKIAFDAVKFLLPEMTETWSNAAELYFIANVVNDAYNVANASKNNPKFNKSSLEKQRLSLIMTLITSKHGYETFYGEDYDALNAINPWLERLYLAAESVECISSEYYASTKSELQKNCGYIVLKDNSSNNTSKPEDTSKPETSVPDVHKHEYSSTYKFTTTDHWQECKCGQKNKVYPHNYGSWTVVKEATEKEDGIKERICKMCGYKETAAILALSHTHSFGDWNIDEVKHWKECKCGVKSDLALHHYTSVVTPPTETEKGYTTHTCDYCGTSYVDSYVDPNVIDSGKCGDNATWELNKEGILTISGKGDVGLDWNIYRDVPWNDYRNDITSCIINNGITSIGAYALDACRNLKSVTLPKTIITIGEYAFSRCTSLTSITIPDSVTSIGSGAFSGCKNLTSITIPDSVTSISRAAFDGCTNLTSITIPDGVTNISEYAFRGCKRLINITIPNRVTSIGNSAFSFCEKLTTSFSSFRL